MLYLTNRAGFQNIRCLCNAWSRQYGVFPRLTQAPVPKPVGGLGLTIWSSEVGKRGKNLEKGKPEQGM